MPSTRPISPGPVRAEAFSVMPGSTRPQTDQPLHGAQMWSVLGLIAETDPDIFGRRARNWKHRAFSCCIPFHSRNNFGIDPDDGVTADGACTESRGKQAHRFVDDTFDDGVIDRQ